MSYSFYHVLHLLGVIGLVAVTSSILTSVSNDKKKLYLALQGILTLIVFVSGFGLIAKIQSGFPTWVLLKILAWLLLTFSGALAFKFDDKRKAFIWASCVAVIVAVVSVSLKK